MTADFPTVISIRRNRKIIVLMCCLLPFCQQPSAQTSPHFTENGRAWLRSEFNQLFYTGKIAGGIIGIYKVGEPVFVHSVGFADQQSGKRITRQTIFRLESMSKPIVAAVALRMMEQNYFSLDDLVSGYLPEIGNMKVHWDETGEISSDMISGSKMSVRHLLTHTSGISSPRYDTEVGKIYRKANIWESSLTLGELTNKISDLPLESPPGENFRYGLSTEVLGRLLEVVAKKPIDYLIRIYVTDPLGMKKTGFVVLPADIGNFATPYLLDRKLNLAPMPGHYQLRWSPDVTLHSPGSGLVSTMDDYLRFCRMLLNKGELNDIEILRPDTVQLMTSSLVPDEAFKTSEYVPGYGMGIGVGVLRNPELNQNFGESGQYFWLGLGNTHFFVDPKLGVAAVFLTQAYPLTIRNYKDSFQRMVYTAMKR